MLQNLGPKVREALGERPPAPATVTARRTWMGPNRDMYIYLYIWIFMYIDVDA